MAPLTTPKQSTSEKKPYIRFVPTKRFMNFRDFSATSKELEEMKTTNNTRQLYLSTEIIKQFPEKGKQTPEDDELIKKYVELKRAYRVLSDQDAAKKKLLRQA